MPLGYAGLTWSSNLGKSGIGSSGLSGSPTFGLADIQHDPMTVGIYQPQIWGGSDQLVRRNLLLNTATLATQNATVLGLSYTLYLKGTGSVTLSGAATGTLNGTGASNRVSLQFTATAGTLTLTVSGSVTEGHLTRTATTDHSYQAVTDWTTEVFQYNAQRQLPWLRRNIILNTDAIDNAYWTKTGFLAFGSGSTVNATTIPGMQSATAELMVENTATDYRQVYRFFTAVAGTYTASAIVKLGPVSNRNTAILRLDTGTIKPIKFNIATGTIISIDPFYSSAAIQDLTGGWYRLSCTATLGAGSNYIVLMQHSENTYAGDGVSGIYVGAMQVERGAMASAYQPVGADWPSTYTALAQAAGYPISLYSDRAGTIAVDSPETVVGKMLDFSTKGNPLVAPTDAARPLLKRDGNGNYYLLRDGVDDSLNVTLPNYGSNCVTYQQDAATCNKATSVTLNGATSLSTPAVDYARVLLQGPSSNDAKIQKYLNKLAGL